MKKLLYVCEADVGGIMEYAIRQAAAIVRDGVEVHFLCKPSFPVNRLADGIVVEKFEEVRRPSNQRRGLAGKIFRVGWMISDLHSEAKRVVELATSLAQTNSARRRPGSAEVVVLFACYKEYFAPFWVKPLRKLTQRGVVIGTIAHDPVRDFEVGPKWWHRWSVRMGYSFVKHVFVHDDTVVDFGFQRPEGIEVHQIPHGPYEVAEPKIGRLEMRRKLGFDSGLTKKLTTEFTEHTEKKHSKDGPEVEETVGSECKCVEAGLRLAGQSCNSESVSLPSKLADSPASESHTRTANEPSASWIPSTPNESAKINELCGKNPSALDTSAPADVVFLAFGQIRDGKNLDLFLRAMTRLPENVKLLVAGKGDSGSSRPPEFYQELAKDLGVADRCQWDIRRIPDEEVGDIFAACDVVLVTYSAKFRSASGVLNAAVSARKPVLASSGSGPLKTVVEKYHLGVFVEPDNFEGVLRGASKLVLNSTSGKYDFTHEPEWARYERENSWEENASRICKALEM